jgi:hypothetical protein
MVKGVERGVEIRSIGLVSKTGGKSGDWHRVERPAGADDGQGAVPRHRPGERSAGRIGRRPGSR